MPNLSQVRDRANQWLADRWPIVLARQEAYFETHGRYWQGLKTHGNVPNHLTAGFSDAVSDLLDGKPTDQAESWLDFLGEIENVPIPAVFVFDVYEAPEGHGYVCTVYAAYNGTVYSRSQNVGPLAERTVNWHVVEAD